MPADSDPVGDLHCNLLAALAAGLVATYSHYVSIEPSFSAPAQSGDLLLLRLN